MEGKILYGKTSPKFIAEVSLADSFSFDLQRFEDEYQWSISGDTYDGMYVYAKSGIEDPIASLRADNTSKYWSLGGGSSNVTIKLDFSDISSNTTLASISSSIASTSATAFHAGGLNSSPLYLNLKGISQITSVLGSNQGDSIFGGSTGISISGGSGADYLSAGSGGATIDGGDGNDSLVGGSGADLFIYGGSGADSIFGYGTSDIVSLSSFPELTKVSVVGGHLAFIESSGATSLTFADANSSISTVTVISGEDKFYYTKDYKMDTVRAAVSLTSSASLYSAADISTMISIDGSAANNTSLTIYGNSNKNSIIGSANVATTIFGGAGDDFVSLNPNSNNTEVYVYGSGNDSLTSIGSASGKVSLASYNLITDGTALASLGPNKFKLTFDNSNTLTFTSQDSINVVGKLNKEPATLTYTPAAISLAGGGTSDASITLGGDWKDSTFTTTGYSIVSAAAVSLGGDSTFAIQGGTDYKTYIYGSDRQSISIKAGSNGDSLEAGAGGASLDNNGKDSVVLIGGSAKDYFLYSGSKATIQNYTYDDTDDSDVVSVYGSNVVPTTEIGQFSLQSSNSTFNISMGGASHVLTFKNTTAVNIQSIAAGATANTLFHYEYDRVIVDNNRITLGPEYTSNFNANARTFTDNGYTLTSIDASHVTVANGINITGYTDGANSIVSAKFGGKIIGGEKNDSLSAATSTYNNGASLSGLTLDGGAYGDDVLIGGASSKDWFIYRGAKDSIDGYSSNQDTIQVIGFDMIRDGVTFGSLSSGDLVLDFGGSDSLTVAGGASSNTTVAIKNGSHTFNYKAGEIVLDDKSVTLTSDYVVNGAYSLGALGASVTAIDASAVVSMGSGNSFVSIAGNNLGNRIIGSTVEANSLVGGSGNDYMSGGEKADVFIYTGGKDTVANYQYSLTGGGDSLVATDFADAIKSARVSGTRLTFTGTNKNNVLTFLSDDEAVEKVSLGGGSGYLTKDGRVTSDGTFNLFSNARGEIDLTAAPYSVTAGTAIGTVNASSISAQSVTLVAGSLSTDNATYILPVNKRRDRFVYAGGHVSISGYDSGKDQINLGTGSINGFSVSDNDDVLISVGGYSGGTANDIISISGGKSYNFLIHQGTDKNTNTYRKMAFTQSGILTDKANKPTSVTVLSGAASLNANDLGGTIKKIYGAANLSVISIEAGDKYNTTIDMSAAGSDVSIYGGKRNDKITGSTSASDLFVYKTDGSTGGKDVITNFTSSGTSGDRISLGSGVSLSSAKITARDKNVTFRFSNKNSLALKSDGTISAVTLAGDTTDTPYMFAKNAYSTDSSSVSLTSSYSGIFNTKSTFGNTQVAMVNGSNVTKNLTFKGTTDNETLVGGTKKTAFKGSGGADSLVGGSGKDTFFYAKNESGTATIADFDFSNDKLKIASGTLATVNVTTTVGGQSAVQFAMKNTSGANVGFFNIINGATYTKGVKDATTTPSTQNTVIKANNTYYWFAPNAAQGVTVGSGKDTVNITEGQLVTYNSKVSSGQIDNSVNVIDLNYSTNLVKSGVAVAISDADKSKVTIPSGT